MVGSIQELLVATINFIALIFSAVAVIMILTAGVLFLTAQGDPAKLDTAKAAFLWGVVGVAIGILAFSIIGIMSKIFY